MIPSRSECLAVLAERCVPDNIIGHSIVVERVALLIGAELARAGNALDERLLSAGALLHDVAKMRGLAEGKPHGELGARTTDELGFVEVSPIVAQHVWLSEHAVNGRIDEAALVNYADKRVNHEQIVTLDERFDYLFERYGSASPEARRRIGEMKRLTQRVETEIFRRLSIVPGDVGRLIEERYGLHSR
jgi:uncharacterized protein